MHFHKKCLYIIISILLFNSTQIIANDTETSSHNVILKLEGVALLRIATGDVSLVIEGAIEAGAPITTITEDERTRLRITSLADAGVNRIVTAKLSKELSGCELLVQAKTPTTGNYFGEIGTFTEPVILGTNDQRIITNIGTCWSGTGEEDGYVIHYMFRIAQTADGKPFEANTTVLVTYTLSDET